MGSGESPGSFILEAHLLPPPSLPLIPFRPPFCACAPGLKLFFVLIPKRPGPQHLGSSLPSGALSPQLGQASAMPQPPHRLQLRPLLLSTPPPHRCRRCSGVARSSNCRHPAPAAGVRGATGLRVIAGSARLHSPAGKGETIHSKVYPQISRRTNGSLVRKGGNACSSVQPIRAHRG